MTNNYRVYISDSDYNTRQDCIKKSIEIDKEIEFLAHRIFVELSKNYVTPFDREDIYGLTKSLRYIGEYFRIVFVKMNLYKIDVNNSCISIYALNTVETISQISNLILDLKNLKKSKEIVEKIKNLNEIINDSKNINLDCIERVFENMDEIKTMIKYREIIINIENINTQMKESIQYIESIIIKHA